MHSAEDKVLNIDQNDIEQYLSEVKEAVEKDNINLFRDRYFAPEESGSHSRGSYLRCRILIR